MPPMTETFIYMLLQIHPFADCNNLVKIADRFLCFSHMWRVVNLVKAEIYCICIQSYHSKFSSVYQWDFPRIMVPVIQFWNRFHTVWV